MTAINQKIKSYINKSLCGLFGHVPTTHTSKDYTEIKTTCLRCGLQLAHQFETEEYKFICARGHVSITLKK